MAVFHKNPPLVLILSLVDPVNAFSKTLILIISSYLYLSLPSGPFFRFSQ